jgi:uncharacterized protein with von Willebrand factor type A (vWA) domain
MEKALLAARTFEDRAAIRDALRFAAAMTPFHAMAYSSAVLEQDYLFQYLATKWKDELLPTPADGDEDHQRESQQPEESGTQRQDSQTQQ